MPQQRRKRQSNYSPFGGGEAFGGGRTTATQGSPESGFGKDPSSLMKRFGLDQDAQGAQGQGAQGAVPSSDFTSRPATSDRAPVNLAGATAAGSQQQSALGSVGTPSRSSASIGQSSLSATPRRSYSDTKQRVSDAIAGRSTGAGQAQGAAGQGAAGQGAVGQGAVGQGAAQGAVQQGVANRGNVGTDFETPMDVIPEGNEGGGINQPTGGDPTGGDPGDGDPTGGGDPEGGGLRLYDPSMWNMAWQDFIYSDTKPVLDEEGNVIKPGGSMFDEYDHPGDIFGGIQPNPRRSDSENVKPGYYGPRAPSTYYRGELAAQYERGYDEEIENFRDWLQNEYAESADPVFDWEAATGKISPSNHLGGAISPLWGKMSPYGREGKFSAWDDFYMYHAGQDELLNETIHLNLESMGLEDKNLNLARLHRFATEDSWHDGPGSAAEAHLRLLNHESMDGIYQQLVDHFNVSHEAIGMIKNLTEADLSHHWTREQWNTHIERIEETHLPRYLEMWENIQGKTKEQLIEEGYEPEMVLEDPTRPAGEDNNYVWTGSVMVTDPSPQMKAAFRLPEPIKIMWQSWQGPIIESNTAFGDHKSGTFNIRPNNKRVPSGTPRLWYEHPENPGQIVGILDSLEEGETPLPTGSYVNINGKQKRIEWTEDPRHLPEYDHYWQDQAYHSQQIYVPTIEPMYVRAPVTNLQTAIWYGQSLIQSAEAAQDDRLGPTGVGPGTAAPTAGEGGGMDGGDMGGMGGGDMGGTGGMGGMGGGSVGSGFGGGNAGAAGGYGGSGGTQGGGGGYQGFGGFGYGTGGTGFGGSGSTGGKKRNNQGYGNSFGYGGGSAW